MTDLLERKRVSRELKSCLDAISQYERAFKSWEGRVKKITDKYTDHQVARRPDNAGARFNILWSNVQTLSAATYSRTPQPDVSRRFKDQDPVGRVAGNILERACDYEIQHYPDFRMTMAACVLDRFLGARGTAWVRYEPHILAKKQDLPVEGDEVTDDAEEPDEELDYECAPVDYVHWRDFGHSVARTWEEVTKAWRRVYMNRDALVERFGKEIGMAIPLDSSVEELKKDRAGVESQLSDTACVYELWDKTDKRAYWFVKSMKGFLDEKDDPLELEEFFPCPRPLYGTLSNDSLEPTPDFALYQDQATELDILADRKDGLIKALKVSGCYDASIPSLARLFTEGENTSLIPVKNWAAFAEKNGLKGAIDLVDLSTLVGALTALYEAEKSTKDDIYEITGISDIVRGQTAASETATAQQIKGQYASLRLKHYQNEVAQFATELLQIKAQIICNKFDVQTIGLMAGVEQLPKEDLQYVYEMQPGPPEPDGQPGPPQPVMGPAGKPVLGGPAFKLLLGDRLDDPESTAPNPMRGFRIEIAADSLVHLDEDAEKQNRVEFLTATGGYLQKVSQALGGMQPQVAAIIVPLTMQMLEFGVRGYPVGKSVEGLFDQATTQLTQLAKQLASQPPPQPGAAEAQAKEAEMQQSAQLEQMKTQASTQLERARMQTDQQVEQFKAQHEATLETMKAQHEAALEQMRLDSSERMERWKAELEASTKITVAQIAAKASLDQTLAQAGQAANTEVEEDLSDAGSQKAAKTTNRRQRPLDQLSATLGTHLTKMSDMHNQTLQAIQGLAQVATMPKRIVRDPTSGRAIGVETARQ